MVNTITKGIHKVIQEKGCCNMKKNTIICISREIRQWRKRGRTAVIQEAWNSFLRQRDFGKSC